MTEQIKILFLLALANSVIIIGFYESCKYELKKKTVIKDSSFITKDVFKYKMFLWMVSYYGDRLLGKFWSKPFYSCITCMASVHSLYVYWVFFDFNTHNLVQYVYYIFLLAGINTIIANKIY